MKEHSIRFQQKAADIARKTKRSLSVVRAWLDANRNKPDFDIRLQKYITTITLTKAKPIEHYINYICKMTNRSLEEVNTWVEENRNRSNFKALLQAYVHDIQKVRTPAPQYSEEVLQIASTTGKTPAVVRNWLHGHKNKPDYELRLQHYLAGTTPVTKSTAEVLSIMELSGKNEGAVRSWYASHRGKANYEEVKALYIESGKEHFMNTEKFKN